MKVTSYRDLVVWQVAMDFVQGVYRLTETFAKSELYGLTGQVRRSAISIASNIAEGHARGSTKEYLRFLGIAHSSLAETETQLLIAERLEMAPAKEIAPLLKQSDEISRMLRRLRQALERKA